MGPVDNNVRTLLDMCFNIVIYMIFNPNFTTSD